MNLSTKPDWWTKTNTGESNSSVPNQKHSPAPWIFENVKMRKSFKPQLPLYAVAGFFVLKLSILLLQCNVDLCKHLHSIHQPVWTIWHSDQLIGLLRHTILYPNTQQADRTQPLPTLPQFKCTQDKTLNLGGHNRNGSIAASPKREDRPISYTPFHSHAQFLCRTVIPTQLCWGHMAGPAMG